MNKKQCEMKCKLLQENKHLLKGLLGYACFVDYLEDWLRKRYFCDLSCFLL